MHQHSALAAPHKTALRQPDWAALGAGWQHPKITIHSVRAPCPAATLALAARPAPRAVVGAAAPAALVL